LVYKWKVNIQVWEQLFIVDECASTFKVY